MAEDREAKKEEDSTRFAGHDRRVASTGSEGGARCTREGAKTPG
jgi:hypothetical protein